MGRGKQNNDSARYLNSIDRTNEQVKNKSFAEAGAYWYGPSDSGAKVGSWCAIQGINNAIVDVSACVWGPGAENMGATQTDDIAIPNGAVVYLNATSITLLSGSALFYKKYPGT